MCHDNNSTNMFTEIMYQIKIRREYHKTVMVFLCIIPLLYLLYTFNLFPLASNSCDAAKTISTRTCQAWEPSHRLKQSQCSFDSKYPLTDAQRFSGGKKYKIAIISDLDEERSKVAGTSMKWQSFLKQGYLYKYNSGRYEVEWTEKIILTSKFNEKGRGFELSDLCVFNGHLYTIDDRTGIIYRIHDKKAIPWVILMDGDGNNEKGFKGEWLTVREGALFVGGLGKEWTTKEGDFVNYNPLFVKSIDQNGVVMHHNWTLNYLKIRSNVGIEFPGYMIHEAVMWSQHKRRWYFLPRRMSSIKYNDVDDEKRGTNVLISADSEFNNVRHLYVGKLDGTHGFSSFKFVPGTNDDVIIALKTKEYQGDIKTYAMIFETETGKILLEEQFIENNKYEGIEFV